MQNASASQLIRAKPANPANWEEMFGETGLKQVTAIHTIKRAIKAWGDRSTGDPRDRK
ncbi:MAG: hypothetical protein P8182_01005 [Deltaproteobacteria bacterium]